MKTKREMAMDAQYELAVALFLEGMTDEAPEAEDYGVSDERRVEIVARAVAA